MCLISKKFNINNKEINKSLKSFNLPSGRGNIINFSYYNSGNAISKCTGWIEFRDIDGLTVKRVELEEILKIYPMERRNFQIVIPNDLISGELEEVSFLKENSQFIADALGVPIVDVYQAGDGEDIAGKARNSIPLEPGIAWQ